MVLTSGIPEPLAAGANRDTVQADMVAMPIPRSTDTQNPTRLLPHANHAPAGQISFGLKGLATQKPNRTEDRAPMPSSIRMYVMKQSAPTAAASSQLCAAHHCRKKKLRA